MNDTELIDLYLARSESAINETEKQYGSYCRAIAMGILHNKEDADECVNDTFLGVWNLIPPQRPQTFSAFIGRITRNISLDRYRKLTSQKRGGGEPSLLLGELESCIPSARNVEGEVDSRFLARAIESFLLSCKKEDRVFFVNRYWYADSVPEIAKRFGVGESKVKMSLHRTRKKLRTYLEREVL